MRNYMQNRGISKKIQISILKYMDYLFKQDEQESIKGEQIIDKLSLNLKKELYHDFYGRILSSSTYIKKNFSQEAIYALSEIMKEKRFKDDEIIFDQGEMDDKLYFVRRGTVILYYHSSRITKSDIGYTFNTLQVIFSPWQLWLAGLTSCLTPVSPAHTRTHSNAGAHTRTRAQNL